MRFVLFLLLISPILQAQEITDVRPEFIRYTNSFLSGGSVGGEEAVWGMSIGTFHGIAISRLKIMGGIGVDGYADWMVYPLMACVSFDLIKKKEHAFYVQVNSGYSLANKLKPIEWTLTFSDHGGMIFNAMVGYRMRLAKVDLYFQSGYKHQRVSYDYSDGYAGWGGDPGYSNTYEVLQKLNRFVFQIGFGF